MGGYGRRLGVRDQRAGGGKEYGKGESVKFHQCPENKKYPMRPKRGQKQIGAVSRAEQPEGKMRGGSGAFLGN